MNRRALDELLQSWAAWVLDGAPPRQTSMLGKAIESGGLIIHGTGGSTIPVCGIEADIEAVLVTLATAHPRSALVLRTQYGVHLPGMIRRTQAQKAQALGISLRTFEMDLARAKKAVVTALENRP